eukprot:snap_masked-scaffold_2-processed-gene-8.5-mRNA-1 protein AED:0.20 eAED:0.20 QI:0/-1/0/1/-1/1/1/0/566
MDENLNSVKCFSSFLDRRDYIGVLTVLRYFGSSPELNTEVFREIKAFCHFALQNYKSAENVCEEILAEESLDGMVRYKTKLNQAVCQLHHGNLEPVKFYVESHPLAQFPEEHQVEKSAHENIITRLKLHLYDKLNDDKMLCEARSGMDQSKLNQLTVAALHFSRGQYQDATDIYKRILVEYREDVALNYYVALCYYKLDYYDVSLEILSVYLQSYPKSTLGLNLKACNHFKLYNGQSAEAEVSKFKNQIDYSLPISNVIKHNQVVFKDGQNALKILPGLLPEVHEAKLNLAIYYLNHEKPKEAHELLEKLGFQPNTPQEYVIRAVTHGMLGQMEQEDSVLNGRENLRLAQQFFQLVGSSQTECDTIPGRQCMASCFFLLGQFEDVNIYLNSIKAYLQQEDAFNFNHGLTLCRLDNFEEAEKAFLMVQGEKYTEDSVYVTWLTRCFIKNGRPEKAWEFYLRTKSDLTKKRKHSLQKSFTLLQLIANDCYKCGHYYYSAKAFDVLESLDSDIEYWEGKRGACMGIFQQVVVGDLPKSYLDEAIQVLRHTRNPQVEFLCRILNKWNDEN